MTVALLLSVAPASASADYVCLVSSFTYTFEASESRDVGPFFSSDGEMLSSVPADQKAERSPLRAGEGLFCVSSDDPRCSPRHGTPDESPQLLSSSHPSALSGSAPRLSPGSFEQLFWVLNVSSERRGLSPRIERPPRA